MTIFRLFVSVFALTCAKLAVAEDNKSSGMEAIDADLEGTYVVSRPGTQQLTCVSINSFIDRYLLPSYDLKKLQVPSGGLIWNWTSEWQMKNMKFIYHRNNLIEYSSNNYVFTDGSSQFLPCTISDRLIVLASNASLWHVSKHSNQDEPGGFLYQMDHLNASTGANFTRVMHCNETPSDKHQEDLFCTTLNSTQNTRILSRGQENSLFMIKSKLDIAGSFRANYTFYTVYQGNDSRKYFELTWTWPTDRQHNIKLDEFSVRSHRGPGFFYTSFDRQVIADEDDNQMSRNFSHPRAGDFCIRIDVERGVRMVFNYQLLNLQDNKVLRQRLVNKTSPIWFHRLNFGHLQAGNYQLTLRNISFGIISADLCPGKRLKKVTTPSLPTPHYCRLDRKFFFRDMSHRSLFPGAKYNATLKTDWDADEWAYVCDQLRVPDNQTERVVIKFCNADYGCNFSKCPHTNQDDQKPLFQMPEVEEMKTTSQAEMILNSEDQTPNITLNCTCSAQIVTKHVALNVMLVFYLLA